LELARLQKQQAERALEKVQKRYNVKKSECEVLSETVEKL
jgi:hypothetical protein